MGHPAVQQAAVIGIHHSKWDERPLLLVVPKPGATPDAGGDPRLLRGQGRQVVDARPGGIRREPAA